MTPEELRAWREARGWSLARLARELGKDTGSIWRYEVGRVPIPQVVVLALEALAARAA